jgi:hypothetical protein
MSGNWMIHGSPHPTSIITRESVEPIALQEMLTELRAAPNTYMEFKYGKLKILASDWNAIIDAASAFLTKEASNGK